MCVCVCVCACVCMVSSFSRVQLFETSWTIAHQAPLSMGFSRQEYWSGLPFTSAGDLSDPGMEPTSLISPALAYRFFITIATCEAIVYICMCVCVYTLNILFHYGSSQDIEYSSVCYTVYSRSLLLIRLIYTSLHPIYVVVVESLSRVRLCATP